MPLIVSESTKSDLSAETIMEALQTLSDELGKRGITGELCLFGGAVMVLAFKARVSTKDVDAIFQPTTAIRDIILDIADKKNLPINWMNDSVKGFVSREGSYTAVGLPQFPSLRLTMPVPEYMLAMKCMAARFGGVDEKSDIPDIQFLIRHLSLKTAKEVLDIVAAYYGDRGIPVKTQYVIEGLFSNEKL